MTKSYTLIVGWFAGHSAKITIGGKPLPPIFLCIIHNKSTQQALLKVYYDFHIAGNGLYTMLVTAVKDSKRA